jgi:ribosomal protein S19
MTAKKGPHAFKEESYQTHTGHEYSPEMIGTAIEIHNGKEFENVELSLKYRAPLREFAPTRAKVTHGSLVGRKNSSSKFYAEKVKVEWQ